MNRYRRALRYLRPYRAVFSVALVASVLTSVLDGFTFALLIPFLRILFDVGAVAAETPTVVERFVDATIGSFVPAGDQASALRALILIIMVAVALKNAIGYLASYLSAYIEESVTRDLRSELYAHLQRLSLAFVQRTKSGQLMSRMLSDVQHARLLVNSGLQAFIRNGVLILVYLAILFGLSWRLGAITLLLAPAIALFMRPLLAGVRTKATVAMERRGELAAIMSETLSGARLVKAHAAEPYERRRFLGVLDGYFSTTLQTQRLAILSSPLSETLGAGVFVLLLFAGAWMTTNGSGLRPELYVAFLAVTLRLLPPVKRISQVPTWAEQAFAGLSRVFEVLDETPDDVDGPNERPFPGLRREIEFRDVSFRYQPGAWVLERLSFRVGKGQVVGLVGYSGAGKSTIVDLLPRFVDPTQGAVLIDGVPTTAYSRRSLREAMAIVSQETIIFNDSVLANIAYGKDPETYREAAVEAARAANAHDFITRLPQGYETRLGERGTHLSGGERQRIALARALLLDPPILILDEATSALDNESEQLVQAALERVMANRTVLLIAHRLSTVATADCIFVLDGGNIVESGRHAELVEAGGLYQRLHEMAAVRRGRRTRERRTAVHDVDVDRRLGSRRSGSDRRES